MSQCARILDYLRTGAELSQAEAYRLGFGLRLGGRIMDLRRMGYQIGDRRQERGVNYSIYYLVSLPDLPVDGQTGAPTLRCKGAAEIGSARVPACPCLTGLANGGESRSTAQGAYYTPAALVPATIDPACGSGAFLAQQERMFG